MMIRGFSVQIRQLIVQREGGRCALYLSHAGEQIHHRRPRGRGGSQRAETNGAANGILVCPWCHDWIEHNRGYAMKLGLLVPSYRRPADVPILYRGEWMRLSDDGGLNPTAWDE